MKYSYLIGAMLLCLMAACTAPKEKSRKPNIILIMADDLGQETIGVYGGQSYQTPQLDKLAQQGMQFTQCYATPLCTPSRVQLMTGKYNFRNYIGFGLLDPQERTFGHAMQAAGYKTCVVGKWQLYGNKKQQELAGNRTGTLPKDAGFDTYRLWQVQDRGTRFKSPTLETFRDGLQTFDNGYGPDKFVEFAEEFMTKHKEDPFFIYYPMVLVHDPFVPTPDSPDFEKFDPKVWLNDTTYFKDMMAYMDKQVGRLVRKTDELGIRENTLILFIGDNGTDRDVTSKWNNQMINGRKGYTVKDGTHVPFIANWKGTISPGQQNANLIDFTDFFPSLLDAAGVGESERTFTDGVSFYPQLKGETTSTRDWVFCDYNPRWGNFKPRRYVQNANWKLYASGDFYHVGQDPGELNPIPDDQLSASQMQLKKQFEGVLARMK